MMTTNFIIALVATIGTTISINNYLNPVKICHCSPHIPRAVLSRSDATVYDSMETQAN